MLKRTKLEIREEIVKIIQEQGYIVPYDLVRKLKMRAETAQRYLLFFEVETGLIKSVVRFRYKNQRVATKWVFADKEASAG